MRRLLRSIDFVLLLITALSLIAGLMFAALGRTAIAHALWTAGAVPVVLALSVSIVQALRRHEAGIDVLALLAIGFALALGEYLTAAVISLMLASGRALETYAQERARREMTALLAHAPRYANRFEAGEWCRVELDAVRPGDCLLVRSGEFVPVDGTLASHAQLDESALTGESVLQSRPPGEAVLSGVVNAGAAFEMVAAAAARDSTFAGIVRMVQSAQQERSPAARLADRYALLFIPVAMLLAGGSWLVTGNAVRALAVLVVATPCPLILAVPVAIVSGMSRCAKRGVLVKGGGALERLAQAKIMFFDKTGTLTGGHARLVAVESDPGTTPDRVLRFAASLAQASGHVISEAVTTAARERNLALAVPARVVEQPGAGLTGEVDGRVVAIGSFAYVSTVAAPAQWSKAFLQRVANEGASAVFVGIDGVMAGAIQMADQIRLETPRALRLLRQEGIRRLVMLTGDRRDVAETIGATLGVTEVRAEQTPADKLAAIHAARAEGTVIMVGDGINDAPALAAADVGIAMGARGAAASSEAADIVLLVDRLDRLVEALRVARRTRRIAVQSVVAGVALSFAAMAVAAFGYLPPLLGAMLQELIDVAVIVNALRALRVRSTATTGTLARGDADRLKAGHVELGPVTEQIRKLADELPRLPRTAIAGALDNVNESLTRELVPHEQRDDTEVYPDLARLLGGEDPMAAMSGMHHEIFRIARLLRQMTADVPIDGPDADSIREFQRLLYGLDAIVRLHCAQEDELFHVLGEGA
ncbi:heavy metal translocating P-type ATPase [Paraburkholderia sp. MMS20-SJTN17]|uniref:P-type Zn(2+) transporter n=1 Tax=Paraburkholderia translucens TaxID=2886945 RepID=A0ABS8KA43_9BURK|nr:heavy metal translocating P-type ATPase [Paraburkholderia sp. MMS20-SJTN17]MCC8401645.1 heavy metal translocating P-type ATPase [Paraburkholderia sp. MMS20-SJTN17]